MKLLYVCYNNKGRSPALEIFTRYFLEKACMDDIVVDSAGVGVESIESLRQTRDDISRITKRILSSYGFDIGQKRIKHMGEIPDDFDIVLAVDIYTLETIEERFPAFYSRSVLAKKYAGYSDSHEIRGPWYNRQKMTEAEWSERAGYEKMINETKNVSRRVVKRIRDERPGKRSR